MSAEALPSGTVADDVGSGSTTRQARLAERVQGIRTRAASGNLDRWLLVVGGILLPLGFLLIVLGWLGASQTVLLFEQIPYMVSGGFLGLAFVFAGGFVYFAYWQTLLVRDVRSERRELVDALERIETLLANNLILDEEGASTVGTVQLVATESGSMVHRADCPVVANRETLRTVTGHEPDLRPCRICEPFDVAEP